MQGWHGASGNSSVFLCAVVIAGPARPSFASQASVWTTPPWPQRMRATPWWMSHGSDPAGSLGEPIPPLQQPVVGQAQVRAMVHTVGCFPTACALCCGCLMWLSAVAACCACLLCLTVVPDCCACLLCVASVQAVMRIVFVASTAPPSALPVPAPTSWPPPPPRPPVSSVAVTWWRDLWG